MSQGMKKCIGQYLSFLINEEHISSVSVIFGQRHQSAGYEDIQVRVWLTPWKHSHLGSRLCHTLGPLDPLTAAAAVVGAVHGHCTISAGRQPLSSSQTLHGHSAFKQGGPRRFSWISAMRKPVL